MLGVSIAAAKADAAEKKYLFIVSSSARRVSVTCAQLNVLNGGRHADNNVDFRNS